jgi:hypothetical protein
MNSFIFGTLWLPLLQRRVQTGLLGFKEENPEEAMILAIGIGALIVLGIIVHFIRKALGLGNIPVTHTTDSPKYGFLSFRQLASSYGLDKDQRKLLESIFRTNGVGDPARVLRNQELLDRHFERAFSAIEKTSETDEEAQIKMMRLFSLRNAIESSPNNNNGLSNTTQIAANTPVVLSTGKDNYTVRVINSKGASLLTEFPKNSLGSTVKLANGTKVTLSCFTKSTKGFSFDSQVVGSIDSSQGPALELAHSGKAKPLVQRHHRRKDINANCFFNLVFLDNDKKNRKNPPKLVVDKVRYSGTILEISEGGCSIKTSTPVQVGSRLRIEVAYDEESLITVLGQVLRVNRGAGIKMIIHVKFLKVPRKSLNSINSLVFGYED